MVTKFILQLLKNNCQQTFVVVLSQGFGEMISHKEVYVKVKKKKNKRKRIYTKPDDFRLINMNIIFVSDEDSNMKMSKILNSNFD